jgi:Domain of unknown function (DUF2804), C-terminal
MTVPWRGPDEGRPELPLPPAHMPLVRGGRPLKRWRWVGAFAPGAMACVARASIGGVPVTWWAAWDGERLQEGTRGVRVGPGHATAPAIDLRFDESDGVGVVSPHGRQYIWTRKQAGLPIRGTLLGRPFEGRGFVDDSAGYHARHTSWRWSAGVGTAESGAAVAWNLVDGVHDALHASERTVWVDGTPHHVQPLTFADDLSGVGALRCDAVAVRAHRQNRLVVASDYEMPFGRFSGSLPVAGALREGWGVMERHRVRW